MYKVINTKEKKRKDKKEKMELGARTPYSRANPLTGLKDLGPSPSYKLPTNLHTDESTPASAAPQS